MSNLKSNKRFLGGWEVDFSDEESATRFLLTHGIGEDGYRLFGRVQTALELHIEGDMIKKLYETTYFEGEIFLELQDENIKLPILDWVDHKVFFLEKNSSENHVIGGSKPKEFINPHHSSLTTPFQYLGYIDGQDPYFEWLGLTKLYLSYPLYECNFGIYLDYSDPLKPVILNPETFTNDWHEPDIEVPDDIQFKETRYLVADKINDDLIRRFEESDDDLILCGVPIWYQSPEVPICPKTNEVMKYVCTINSDSNIKITNHERDEYNDYLIFGDYGHLYVFFHPESKILYLVAQW